MKDTVRAKDGYRVKPVINAGTPAWMYRVYDGARPLFVAEKRSCADYREEKGGNECFRRCEVFTTVKGNQFIYWRDEETDADYITKVPEEEQK